MMPLIQPLPNAYSKPTEYQKERAGFAELEVELRSRKRRASGLQSWLPRLHHALSRLGGGVVPGGETRRAER